MNLEAKHLTDHDHTLSHCYCLGNCRLLMTSVAALYLAADGPSSSFPFEVTAWETVKRHVHCTVLNVPSAWHKKKKLYSLLMSHTTSDVNFGKSPFLIWRFPVLHKITLWAVILPLIRNFDLVNNYLPILTSSCTVAKAEVTVSWYPSSWAKIKLYVFSQAWPYLHFCPHMQAMKLSFPTAWHDLSYLYLGIGRLSC